MNWYYAEAGQQRGPISDWDFANATRTGVVRADTLVWHEGLPEWMPLSRVRPDLVSAANAAVIGGMAVPEAQKELLIQQMREGVLPGNLGQVQRMGAPVYVGFWWRALAYLIDIMLTCMVAMPLMFVFPPPHHQNVFGPPQPGAGIFDINWTYQIITTVLVCGYYTILTGLYGGTVGKLALGFKVVCANGEKVSYLRALGRYFAAHWLNAFILGVFAYGLPILVIVIRGGFALLSGSFDPSNPAAFLSQLGPGVVLLALLAMFIGVAIGTFPWWMAGSDREKRALHDRVCSTRVVWARR